MNIQSIHFIDIETVPAEKDFPMGQMERIWLEKKCHDLEEEWNHSAIPQEDRQNHYRENAGLSAEFGKVVCVSIGKMHGDKFYIKSICDEKESVVLNLLSASLELGKLRPSILAGHNIIEFDIPFLMRRFLANGISLPAILNNFDRKPWETPYRDTMKMWSSTQWNYKVSLNLLAELFGLPSPKENMEGKDVADLFYSSDPDKLVKIANYCSGDVFTTANVYCKMTGQPLILESQIERV